MIPQQMPATQSGASLLPHDLSPWSMFLSADIVVQTVMVGLMLASVVTWSVWLAKTVELRRGCRRVRDLLAVLETAGSLRDAIESVRSVSEAENLLLGAAVMEVRRSAGASSPALQGRITSKLDRLESAAGRRMASGIGVLATIGSTAPFVGLFGTVWGIMNAFVGISKAQTTNLAVVAPGIAEALLATAVGLVAAIPAVVIYNTFSRSITGYRALLGDASAAVLRIVSRDLDCNTSALQEAAE